MRDDAIAIVRSFSRSVTQRVGIFTDRFLGRDRPLAEARLIFEIGRDGCEVRELRSRLDLDSGYMSRLLRSLERQGLLDVERQESDRRKRRAALTEAGKRELEELDQRGDQFARSLLEPLSERQRERMVRAMAEVELLLAAAATTIELVEATTAEARWCVEQYFAELDRRFEQGFDLGQTISAEPQETRPPHGAFLIARLDERAVGCGALKTSEPGVGSIKRMWVAPEARGLGLGRRLLAALEQQARDLGLHTLRLETNRVLAEAQALYRRNGYLEVAAFNDDPHADHWFEKRL
ncbi:MAG: bifunctional helix-turn-helix transcriptional regulator/GNAT family N-acetyltransferase [Acidobacteriota bacterium]